MRAAKKAQREAREGKKLVNYVAIGLLVLMVLSVLLLVGMMA